MSLCKKRFPEPSSASRRANLQESWVILASRGATELACMRTLRPAVTSPTPAASPHTRETSTF